MIDELVVTLGIDGSKFKTDATRAQADITRVSRDAVQSGKALEDSFARSQKATSATLKQGAEVGRQASVQFGRFRTEVAALFTTLATGFGIQKFVKDLANTEAATGRLAKNIGISTGELDAWQQAAARNGGTAEATGQSLLGLTQQFQQLSLGGMPESIKYFRALGVSISDANNDMRPMSDILLDLSDKFKNMSPQRANAFGAALGLDQGTITLLRQGRQAVEEYLAEARKIGAMSEEDAQAGIKFQQSLSKFEQSIRNLGLAIGNDLMPIFETYMDQVTAWLSSPEGKEFVTKEVHEDIQKFADGIKAIIEHFSEFKVVAEGIAAFMATRWIVSMTAGLGPVGLAVAGIAAGFLAIKTLMGDARTDPKDWAPDSPLWAGVTPENQLKYPNSPESRIRAGKEGENPNPFHWWNPGSWLNRPEHLANPFASGDMNNVQRGFLDTLAGPESGGRYDLKNGGSTFNDFSRFPDGIGPGGTTTASGRYQITKDTWSDLQKKYPGMLGDFSPKNQDAAAWLLARDRYAAGSGGADLEDDLRAGKNSKIARILGPTWPSLPGGSQSHQTQADFDAALARNTAGQFSASQGLKDAQNPLPGLLDRLKGAGSWLTAPMGVPADPKAAGGPHAALDPSLKWGAMGHAQRTALAANGNAAGSVDQSVEVHVAAIHVNGENADTVARNLGESLRKYAGLTGRVNTGLA